MTTVRQTITRAYRMLGVLGEGNRAPSADQAVDGLEALGSLYLQLISAGRFGPMTDVAVEEAYTAGENERIADISGLSVAITLPTTIADTDENGDATTRAPQDRSVVQIAGGSTYIYDIGNPGEAKWVSVDSLTLDSVTPLSARYATPIAALLACAIAAETGFDPPAMVLSMAEAGRATLRIKKPIAVAAPRPLLRLLANRI